MTVMPTSTKDVDVRDLTTDQLIQLGISYDLDAKTIKQKLEDIRTELRERLKPGVYTSMHYQVTVRTGGYTFDAKLAEKRLSREELLAVSKPVPQKELYKVRFGEEALQEVSKPRSAAVVFGFAEE